MSLGLRIPDHQSASRDVGNSVEWGEEEEWFVEAGWSGKGVRRCSVISISSGRNFVEDDFPT